jgi:hypothetical protein
VAGRLVPDSRIQRSEAREPVPATAFPLQWQRVHDLVTDRVCVDPVLHFHEGHWYLFANVAESGKQHLGRIVPVRQREPPWAIPPASLQSHRERRAPRTARRQAVPPGRNVDPTGAGLRDPVYGAAVVFNEILELDPTHYRERVLSRLGPDWDASLDGCHTYSAADGIEVLDAHGVAPAAMTSVRRCRRGAGIGLASMIGCMSVSPLFYATSPSPCARAT